MRYFLTLPFAALALSAAPALAQDTAMPPVTQPDVTAPTPPADPTAPVPPADPTTATPPVTEPTPAPAPEAADPVAPAAPATPTTSAPANLTAEQKAAYDGWPATTKSYFDGLTPARQALFLRLADADKAKVVALPAEQQESLWASLEKQDAEQKATTPGSN